jgi:hypothetical protein
LSGDLSLRQLQFLQTKKTLLQQMGEGGKRFIDDDIRKLLARVHANCGIPADGDPPEPTPERLNCLEAEYRNQQSAWMAQLMPPAHEEASRPIHVHFRLQEALRALGFLKDSDPIDGIYGPNTRSAIIQWQKARQLPLTGLLDAENSDALAPFSDPVSAKVLNCYNAAYRENNKLLTIQEMRDCAGVWVTPRALVSCTMNGRCPVLPDTEEGRAALAAALNATNANFDTFVKQTVLALESQNMPLKPVADQLATCKTSVATKQEFVACSVGSITSSINAPQYIALRDCMSKDSDDARFGCLAETAPGQSFKNLLPGGDVSRAAQCFADSDQNTVGTCLLGESKEVRSAQQIINCVLTSTDETSSLISNCTNGVVGANTAHALSCAVAAGSDRLGLAKCAAGAVLPPETARLVSCAATSQGATSFALCSAAPAMNEEWRIAAECAVQSGGQPYVFAGCTATRLTVRELTKCFTGQFGKDCYGPNNTLVVTLRNEFHDILQGPGKNNDAVKAVEELGKDLQQGEMQQIIS